MNVRLVVDHRGQRKVFPLRQDQSVIGRAQGVTVRVPSAEVSRQHCRLTKAGGVLKVRDLGSVNGTLLNGVKVRGEEVVRPGDKVGVGPVTFTVEYELSPEALERLREAPADVGILAGLADGDVVEFDVEDVPLDESPAQTAPRKKPRPRDEDATVPADDLAALAPDFDVGAWQMPDGGDLRGLLDDEGDAPKKKPKR